MGALIAVMIIGGTLTAALGAHPTHVGPRRLSRANVVVPHVPNRLVGATPAATLGIERVDVRAPSLALTDAAGQRVALSALAQHHVVVLAFVAQRCRDVCPVLLREMAAAAGDLGSRAGAVEFVAINVDPAHTSPAAARAFLADNRGALAPIGHHFSFLTAPAARLRHVWAAFQIRVQLEPNGALVHTQALDFVAPGGTLVARATPYANETHAGRGSLPAPLVRAWGRGIAHFARAAVRG